MLQIVEDLKIGGLERVIQAIASGLPKDRYDVRVWCLTKGGDVAEELRAAGIAVEELGMGPRCSLKFLFNLRRKLIQERIDILHAHGYPANTIGRFAGLMASVPVIIAHVHSTYWQYTFRQNLTVKILSLFSDKVLCCSVAVAEYVQNWQKVAKGKVAVLYNSSVDMGALHIPGARKAFGLAQEDFVVGVAASLVGNKGHECFLEAMSEVVKVYPQARGLLAGTGPLRSELEGIAAKLGINKNIIFCGLQHRMESFYSAIDLLVQAPLYREGLSISILEAMSAGRPVVGSRIGGIPEAVVDGSSGLLVPPGDPAALAEAIITCICDKAKLAVMGRAARAAYLERFTPSALIANITGIYEELYR